MPRGEGSKRGNPWSVAPVRPCERANQSRLPLLHSLQFQSEGGFPIRLGSYLGLLLCKVDPLDEWAVCHFHFVACDETRGTCDREPLGLPKEIQ